MHLHPGSAPNLPTGQEREERKKPDPSAKEVRRGERAGEDVNKILENGMQTDEGLAFSPQLRVWGGEEASSAEPRTILAYGATEHLQDRGKCEAETRRAG